MHWVISAHPGYYNHYDSVPSTCLRFWNLPLIWWELNSNPSTPRPSKRVFYEAHRWVTFIRKRPLAVLFYQQHRACRDSNPDSPDYGEYFFFFFFPDSPDYGRTPMFYHNATEVAFIEEIYFEIYVYEKKNITWNFNFTISPIITYYNIKSNFFRLIIITETWISSKNSWFAVTYNNNILLLSPLILDHINNVSLFMKYFFQMFSLNAEL